MAVLEALGQITAYSFILYGVILLYKKLFHNRISPGLHYVLWFILIARLAIPVTFASPVHLLTLPQSAPMQEGPVPVESPANDNNAIVPLTGTDVQPILSDLWELNPAPAAFDPVFSTAVQPIRKVRIEWQDALVGIWLAGAAAMLLYLIVMTLRMKTRIRRESMEAPEKLVEMFAALKRGLHIRSHLDMRIIREGVSPCLTASIRPRLLMPAALAEHYDENQLSFAIAHELMHYRRKDHLVCLLMNFLRCVYWFNPVVWLSAKQIQMDMETACDSDMVKSMGNDDKKRYAQIILDLFSFSRTEGIVVGMALGGGKQAAERRIRGIFMKRQSSKGARRTSLLLVVAMLVACFTTACQPTPEEPIVIQKDQGRMLDSAVRTQEPGNTSVAQKVGAPGNYSPNVSAASGKMKIVGNAPVVIPSVGALPTARVQAADFSDQTVNGMVSALFGEQSLYDEQGGSLTKEDITADILRWKQRKTEKDYASPGNQASIDETIEQLEAQYATAPEKSETSYTKWDGRLLKKEIVDQKGQHVAWYMGVNLTNNPEDSESAAMLSVQNNSDQKEAIFELHEGGGGGGRLLKRSALLEYRSPGLAGYGQSHAPVPIDEGTVIDDPEVLDKLKTTPAEAAALARDTLHKAGIDYMDICDLYLTDDENTGNVDGIVSSAQHYAYELHLCRMVSGAPCAYLNASSSGGSVTDENIKQSTLEGTETDLPVMKYAGNWSYETMKMLIDDRGVISLSWMSPLNITETLVEDTSLIPFGQAEESFERHMRDTYEPQAKEESVADMTFTVQKVSLELQRVAEQNSIENGLLVPVWNFYGTGLTHYSGSSSDKNNEIGQMDQVPLLTVNAIDGSVIDPYAGY